MAQKSIISLWNQGNKAAKHSAKEALVLHQQAFELAKKENNYIWQANILTDISGAYFGLGQYADGTDACLQGIRILEIHKISIDSIRFKLLSALAANYKVRYRIADSQKYYALANNIIDANPQLAEQIPLYAAYHYSNQGALWLKLYDLQQSRMFYEKALQIAKKIPEKSEFALILSNLAKFYLFNEDFDKGIEATKNAITAYRKLAGYNKPELGKMYLMLGDFYLRKNQFAEARNAYKLSLKLCSSDLKNADSKFYADFALLSIVEIDIHQKNFQSAENLIKHISLAATNTNSLYEYWKVYGELFEAKQQNEKALECFSKALNITKTNNDDIKSFEIYNYLSNINYKLFSKNNKDVFLQNSLNQKLSCIAIAKRIRQNFFDIDSKVFFTDKYYNLYKDAIKISFLLISRKKDTPLLEQTFQLAEEAKSVSLSDKQFINNTFRNLREDSLLIQVNDTQEYLSYLKNQKEKNLQDINNFEISLRKLIEKIRFSNQALSSIFQPESLASYQHLKSKIPQKTIYLNYFILENQLFLIACDTRQLFFRSIALNKTVYQSQLHSLTQALSQEPSKHAGFTGTASCEFFYNLLVKSVFPEIGNYERIIVNPDNDFYNVSFDILQNSRTQKYLIETHAITYTNNLEKVVTPARKIEISKKWNIFLPLNDSLKTLASGLKPLKFSWQEIKGVISDFYTDPNTGKKTFMSKLQKDSTRVVMIATHAEAGNGDPFLIFNNSSTNAARLYASELKYIDTKVPLVILSACQTNSGKTFGGLGVQSFSKSLELSGCPAVVGSFWQAEDNSLSVLVSLFYRNLMKGMDKDIALQKAKIEYLSTDTGLQNDIPFYWAHFQLMGNNQPIVYDNFWLRVMIFSVLMLLGGFAIYWFRKS